MNSVPTRPQVQINSDQIMAALDSTAIISVSDPKGHILYANELFSLISGYPTDELIGKNHNIINSGYHSEDFWIDLWSTIKAGKTWKGEIKNRKKNGDLYWVYAIIFPQVDELDQISQFVSIRFDITEKKNLEQLLSEERSNSLQLGKLVELAEISNGVAHEINNPMAIIAGKFSLYKRVVSSKIGLDETLEAYSLSIENSIERVIKITKNFLSFSRSHNEENAQMEVVSAKALLSSALSLVSEKVKSLNINLTTSIEETNVYCHSAQIQQVLLNLILNSIYEAKNHNPGWINIEVKSLQDFVQFAITDSGAGIPPEIQKKLMRPFFTTKPIGVGTGLGLSACKRIIDAGAGDFYYDSKSPNTRFVFHLPKNKNAIIGTLNAENAIKAHLNWKSRILNDIKNNCDNLQADQVSDFNLCDLGKWLTKVETGFTNDPEFHKLVSTHKAFHLCIEGIVKDIQEGSPKDINLLLSDSDSRYNKLSNEIISLLHSMKQRV